MEVSTLVSTPLVVTVAALWGALAGALLPRAAYRFAAPDEEPWRAHCPGGHPVAGWLGPAGCHACGPRAPYGPGATVPVLVTAAVCAALAAATGTRPELGAWLLLAPCGVLLTLVDLRVRRLPDPLTLSLAGGALALLGLVAAVPEHAGHWPTAAAASLALGAFYYGLHLLNPDGMGFGDVKLALGAGAVLGWYGWPTVMLGTFAGFLSGALYGWGLVALRRADRTSAIPFGPFLLGGALTGVLIGAYAA
ncbi:prepilin peptidase [Streptomyces nigra]|uniref:prepilin peptidase n=1 Tax=Streptomyces nigra TaxID=1827580 RepID=UPI0036368BD6